MKELRPLEKVYWLRLALGVVAAIVSTGYGIAFDIIPRNPPIEEFPMDFSSFMNGVSLALVVYLLSYYFIKFKFATEVKKPQKLVTTGIGVYFLAWIVLFVLLYTIIAGAPALA